MTKFIILSHSDTLSLFHDKPVNVYVDHIPYVICTDGYYEDISQDKGADMMDEQEESNCIKDKLEDLSKRVDNIEKQMKKDKEEQLKKLQAEIEYAKFCCALPTIQHIIGGEK